MEDRGQGRLVAAFPVLGVAFTWATAAIVVQLLADWLVLRLPFSIMPPRWWWNSALPWPQSFLTASIFVAVSVAFVVMCIRRNMAARHVLIGMAVGLMAIHAWVLVESIGFFTHFGALQGLSFARMNAAVRMSGIAGTVLGAPLGAYLAGRRNRPVAVGATSI